MPSGAKKRKAAKKKLQKVANSNGSHPQGVDDPKSHDGRGSDGEVEREENFEGGGVNNGEEGAKEVSVREENVSGVAVQTDDVARELKNGDVDRDLKNGDQKSSSSSSSSSSSGSDDEEVVVEKEKLAEAALVNEEQQDVEASVENSVASEVVDNAVEESIPLEESVKQVVSAPQENTTVIESASVENMSTSDVVESGLKQNVDEVSRLVDEKSEVVSVLADLVQKKIEEKVIPVVNEGSGNTAEPGDVITRDDAGLLPQSSESKAAESCGVDDNGKMLETHKHTEQEPLISVAPLPVRRTSWMGCCGLFEVFSGGSSR